MTAKIQANNSKKKSLYNQDYYLWLVQTTNLLEQQKFTNLDLENLIEEIESLGKSEKRALKSYTRRLIQHILKLKYWESEKERNRSHWQIEVINFRRDLKDILEDSPSLKNYLSENYSDWYQKTVVEMRLQFDIPPNNFVELETIFKDDYFG